MMYTIIFKNSAGPTKFEKFIVRTSLMLGVSQIPIEYVTYLEN